MVSVLRGNVINDIANSVEVINDIHPIIVNRTTHEIITSVDESIAQNQQNLNDYTKACRSNKYAGAKMKEDAERKGSVTMELLNSQKQPLLLLDETHPTGSIAVEKGQRYQLVFHFQSATGEYSLQMD